MAWNCARGRAGRWLIIFTRNNSCDEDKEKGSNRTNKSEINRHQLALLSSNTTTPIDNNFTTTEKENGSHEPIQDMTKYETPSHTSHTSHSQNTNQTRNPEELESSLMYSCYYCKNFQTYDEDEYRRHGGIRHAGKPIFPSKADLQKNVLNPQGKPWEIETTTQLQEERTCPICNHPGQRRVVELQPTDGELWRVDHGDGTICEWDRHNSIESLFKIRPQNTDYMVCPLCSESGKIITFRKDIIHKPYKYDYKISHGKKFCEIIDQVDRDEVLKKLGRYVGEDQQQPQQRKQPNWSKRPRITCTVCFKPGAVRYISPKTQIAIYEHRDEPPIGEYVNRKTGKKSFRYRRCYGGRAIGSLQDLISYPFGRRKTVRRPKM